MDSKKIVHDYLDKLDWRVSENSNAPFSFGAMNKYMTSEVSKDYWLRHVYPNYVSNAYLKGEMHIHDLGTLSVYCCGYSLKDILIVGVKGVPNIPKSKPAKHFDAALNQIANLVTVFQNEIAGAVAFNSFDTLLAPFIKADNMTYKQVKQSMQNFIFSINSNSRIGAEPAFSNITFDITPPDDMLHEPIIIGGELDINTTYKDCQPEMDILNRAFCEVMIAGDADGRGFAYPIPTYNIHDRFDWDNLNSQLIWEMAGKYGYPYFSNFLNSDMKPSDVRSMCCRLRLDLNELQKRNGGLFGSGDSTGSIGVCTINLPRIAYTSKGDRNKFYHDLDRVLNIAKDSLEIKREWLQKNMIDNNAIPAFCTYVGTLDNHFSTIGVIGENEMCENFFGEGIDILTEQGKKFALEVNEFIRHKLIDFQNETGNLYNLEATPAEGATHSLALRDRKEFGDIITRGTEGAWYYTNSCHMPVAKVETIKNLLDHQDELQVQYTGGTVVHIYLDGAINADQAKHIIKTACNNYKLPYISLSPLNRYCEEHGYVEMHTDKCPTCGRELDLYQRITGYLRKVEYFNKGKKSEFYDRNQLFVED